MAENGKVFRERKVSFNNVDYDMKIPNDEKDMYREEMIQFWNYGAR